ncbi:putative hydrolase [Arcanobacterium wilhelmae]|uniref:Hydrolase n=1 Tax=Arcanobacterium wilhelmae TaxID=1803177 RepID=A0ABT9N9S4_9ACTO|nr:zinc-dependent metalloprotease [Arcanobacterium wilhelmae]MDP9800472.1 putative hydrolase [Arcanobacterium wilhelmae]WFN89891.1 zinc-dependent metalloprotease [Arcanobacterium wilhelmae]
MAENNDWEAMLRAVLGDAAADDIIANLRAQGIDPATQMEGMLSPANFDMVVKQVKDMLGSTGEGPVNWQIAERVARETVTSQHFDRLSGLEGDAARRALSTASLWLDAATDIDPATGPAMAFSRLDWVAHALPTLKKILDPVGANIARAFGETMKGQQAQLPPGMLPFDPSQMVGGLVASLLGMQYGKALAELAVSSFGTTDTGIPLVEGSFAGLVPTNVDEFARGIEGTDTKEVELYVAVREAAAARLYTRVPWLRSRVVDSVAQFAHGIEIDMSSIEEQVRELRLDDPSQMENVDLTDVFDVEFSPAQKEAQARLEHLLSLIEGWVSEVSARAVSAHLPNFVALSEMFSRRYATDNPAKHVWSAQLGLELAPKRLREAAAFWRMAEAKLGIEGRDALWAHPDLLPEVADLDNPAAFFDGSWSRTKDLDAELDSFLEDVLSGSASDSAPHEPKFGDDGDAASSEGGTGDDGPGGTTPSDDDRQ